MKVPNQLTLAPGAKADVTNDTTSLLRASVWKLLSTADTGPSVLLPVMSL